MADLVPRAKSVFLFAPPLLIAGVLGGWPLAVLVTVIAQLAAGEIERMLGAGILYTTRLALLLISLAPVTDLRLLWLAYPMVALEFVPGLLSRDENKCWERGFQRVLVAFFSCAYLGLIAFWIVTRDHGGTPALFLWTVGVIWANDVAAYLIGSRWGRGGLVPSLSPNKSWQGAAAGLAGGLIVGAIGGAFLGSPVSYVLAGIAVAAAGQLGDLFESMIKRAAGVKDSGDLFPGHGGALDRIDSLLFAFPVVFALLQFGFLP